MLLIIILILFIFFLGIINSIMYIYNYMWILVRIGELNLDLFNINELNFYDIDHHYTSKHIVYLIDKKINIYFCRLAYRLCFDSELVLVCDSYNLKTTEISICKDLMINLDLLENYELSLKINLLKDKLPDDILIHIKKFITNINFIEY